METDLTLLVVTDPLAGSQFLQGPIRNDSSKLEIQAPSPSLNPNTSVHPTPTNDSFPNNTILVSKTGNNSGIQTPLEIAQEMAGGFATNQMNSSGSYNAVHHLMTHKYQL